MAKLWIFFHDKKEEIVKDVTGAGLEDDKLLITSKDGEKHYTNVANFEFDYRGPYFTDYNEITQD